jgi:hypothetical protein
MESNVIFSLANLQLLIYYQIYPSSIVLIQGLRNMLLGYTSTGSGHSILWDIC